MSSLKESKSKLSTKEARSVESTRSLQVETILSTSKDPLEFLGKRGYEAKEKDLIGEGAFAKVYRGRMKNRKPNEKGETTYTEIAIKVFELSVPDMRAWVESRLKSEMFISRNVKHVNVILTAEVLKTTTHGYIIMQFAANGSIKSDLCEQLKRPYNDEEAKKYFTGLMNGLQYLHSENIAHRDLKIDNFLLTHRKCPQLADFGFSIRIKVAKSIKLSQIICKTPCGTAGYMAPEFFPKQLASAFGNGTTSKDFQYDAKAVDIFAMGVSLFEMTNLLKPFKSEMSTSTMRKIASHEVKYLNPKVEPACKELIQEMLRLQPTERPNADEVLKHRWISHGSFINSFIDKIF